MDVPGDATRWQAPHLHAVALPPALVRHVGILWRRSASRLRGATACVGAEHRIGRLRPALNQEPSIAEAVAAQYGVLRPRFFDKTSCCLIDGHGINAALKSGATSSHQQFCGIHHRAATMARVVIRKVRAL